MRIDSATFVKGITSQDDILADGMPQCALVGRSNAGKSSIVNVIAGAHELARVGKKPGKTTEINFYLINKQFYLVDLPGYGFAEASLESREKLRPLIIWYLTRRIGRPQCILLVVDAKVGMTTMDEEMLALLREQELAHAIVVNKIDKLNQKDSASAIKGIKMIAPGALIIPFSSANGRGLKELSSVLEKAFPGASDT